MHSPRQLMQRRAFYSLRHCLSDYHWAWLYLIVAILLEVLGLTVMKLATERGSMLGHIALYLLIGLSYILLAKAVRKISVGVAYAIWEGSGIALITLVSWLIFAHELTLKEMAGLTLAVIGIALVNAGHLHESAEQPETRGGSEKPT